VILFIALPEAKDNIEPGDRAGPPAAAMSVCRNDTIIGHGRRLRQSHDGQHEWIWVRRGICEPCRKTFTVLPDWLAPSGHYSLHCDSSLASGSPPAILPSKRRRTAKIRLVCPTPPLCADGRNGD